MLKIAVIKLGIISQSLYSTLKVFFSLNAVGITTIKYKFGRQDFSYISPRLHGGPPAFYGQA